MRFRLSRSGKQLRVKVPGIERLRPLWWLHPHFAILFLGIPLLIVSYLIPESTYVTLYRTPKYVDMDFLLIGLVVYLGFFIGAFFSFNVGRESQERDIVLYCRWFVWPLFGLTVFGHLVWYGNTVLAAGGPKAAANQLVGFLLSPEAGMALYLREEFSQTVPGISTLALCDILYSTVEALLWVRRRSNRRLALLRVAVVLSLVLIRAVFLTERLALIEVGVPVAVVLAAGWEATGKYLNALRFAPFLLVAGALGAFASTEHLRSWTYYRSIFPGNYFEFVSQRFLGYYTTSVNNAAVHYYFQPLQPFRYTFNPLFKFPGLGDIVNSLHAAVFGDTYIEIEDLLNAYASYEFNVTPVFGLLLNEWSVFLAPVVAFLLGLLCSILYRSFSRGRLVGALLYPSWFIGLLEISRIYYWAHERYFPVLAFLIVSLVLYRFARVRTGREQSVPRSEDGRRTRAVYERHRIGQGKL